LVRSTDNDADFSDDFCAFLQRNVTSVDAAELLLLLYRQADTAWRPPGMSQHLLDCISRDR
jgi:hypothetical protein